MESGFDPAGHVTLFLAPTDGAASFVRRRVDRAERLVGATPLRETLISVSTEAERHFDRLRSRRMALGLIAGGGLPTPDAIELDAPVENELVVGGRPALRQLLGRSPDFERALVAVVLDEGARIVEVVLPRGQEARRADRPDAPSTGSSRGPAAHPAGAAKLRYRRVAFGPLDPHLPEIAGRLVLHCAEQRPAKIVVGGSRLLRDRLLHRLPAELRVRAVDVVSLEPGTRLAEVGLRELEETHDAARGGRDGVADAIRTALEDGPAAVGSGEVGRAAAEGRIATFFAAREPDAALARAVIERGGSIEHVPRSELLRRCGGMAAALFW